MAQKCILLRGNPIYGEALALTPLLPGMIATVAGLPATVSEAPSVSPAAANAASVSFVRENEVMGGGIDDDYGAGDTVLTMKLRPGDHAQGWLAVGESVTAGAELSSAGSGSLGAADPGDGGATPVELPTKVIALALEEIDNSGGASAVRIKVEAV